MGQAGRRQLMARGPAAILDLIPAVLVDALPAATLAARDLDDPELRARALLAIRQRTGSAARDPEILAAARAAGEARPELLLAWAAADPAHRGPQLVDACRTAARWERGLRIAEGVAIAAPATLGALLELAESLGHADLVPVLQAFDRRAGDPPPEVRDGVITLARAPRGRRLREERLAAVLHLLGEDERRALVDRWQELAPDPDDPRFLAALPWLDVELRRGVVASALLDEDAEPSIAALLAALPEDDRVALFLPALAARQPGVPTSNLAALAAALPAGARPEASAETERRTRGARRVEVLAALLGDDPSALVRCLDKVDDAQRASTWAAVVLGLPNDPPREIAPAVARLARLVPDARVQVRLLATIAPLAGEPLRTTAVRDVLSLLAGQAATLEWHQWAALAQAAEPGEATEAIGIVRASLRGAARDDVVATLAPALDDDTLVDLLADLASSRPSVAVQVVSATAASLSPEARGRAMHAVAAIRRPGTRAVAMAHLLAPAPTECVEPPVVAAPRDATPEATLDLARRGGDDDMSEVLQLLHPVLDPGLTLDAALDLGPGARAMVLTELRPSLPVDLRRRADAALAPLEAAGYAGGGMGAGAEEAASGVTSRDAADALEALFPTAAAVAPGGGAPTRGISFDDLEPTGLERPVGARPRRGVPTGARRGVKPPTPATQPHVAYGHLDAPAEVVAGKPFVLEVGLDPKPSPGVAGAALKLPGLTDDGYLLDIRIAAPGFVSAAGESRRRSLLVATGQPFPKTTVTLIPKPVTDDRTSRLVTAEFWVAGERLGDAIRVLTVLASADLRTRPEHERVETGIDVPGPTGMATPDLTITIRRSDPPGKAEWTFESPHDAVVPVADPILRPLGDAAAFLRDLISQVDEAEGRKAVFGDVLGLGHRIGQLIPGEVWTAIRAAAGAADGPPTILLECEEPYVPWELAEVVGPPLHAGTSLPPFLAAQARVSRWVSTRPDGTGVTRPPAIPPTGKTVASVGVVWGSYRGTRWGDLVHASREGRKLKLRFAGTRVIPDDPSMFDLLKNKPAFDLLHFAVHGRYDPGDAGNEDGILLVDGNVLHANAVAARDLTSHPVVFLNACQLAAGKLELASYSGIAAAFIEAGASAVVAPLWKVDDEIAMQMAFDFYDAIVRGDTLAEVLRHAREQFVDDQNTRSSTWMAYQLYAHPSFTVDGLK